MPKETTRRKTQAGLYTLVKAPGFKEIVVTDVI
jgi:hypothetical protein